MPRKPPFTEAQLRDAISQARSWAEACRLLGYRPVGGNPETVKRHVRRLGISTDHFNPKAAMLEALDRGRHNKRPAYTLDEILVSASSYSRSKLKDRLYKEGLKQRRCELCGQGENWRGRPISLVLDHINGVGNDNRLENLQIVCPNCAATLDTHCGRNLPRERTCVGCGTTFAPTHIRHRYCSLPCFNATRVRGDSSSTFARPRLRRRRVERPAYRELLDEIERSGYAATGRKYGVSDNAIRKWVRQYECERAIAEGRDPDVIEIPRRTWPSRRRDAA